MIYPAISIRQPWAEAIISVGKNIENRTWKCPEKYLNRWVLIHAGKELDREANTEFYTELRTVLQTHPPRGGIVGAMKILSGHEMNLHVGPDGNRWASGLCFNWELARARYVPFLPCKGKLGFFQVDYPFELND
jgi:hypothetical protein